MEAAMMQQLTRAISPRNHQAWNTSVIPVASSSRRACGEYVRCMSSGSVIGRCRMMVPAPARMTTMIRRTTPVLIEEAVCQTLRGHDLPALMLVLVLELPAIFLPQDELRNARSEPSSAKQVTH